MCVGWCIYSLALPQPPPPRLRFQGSFSRQKCPFKACHRALKPHDQGLSFDYTHPLSLRQVACAAATCLPASQPLSGRAALGWPRGGFLARALFRRCVCCAGRVLRRMCRPWDGTCMAWEGAHVYIFVHVYMVPPSPLTYTHTYPPSPPTAGAVERARVAARAGLNQGRGC